jgi:hypothetical protein
MKFAFGEFYFRASAENMGFKSIFNWILIFGELKFFREVKNDNYSSFGRRLEKIHEIEDFLSGKGVEVSKPFQGDVWPQNIPDEMEGEIRKGIEEMGGMLLKESRLSSSTRLYYDFGDI